MTAEAYGWGDLGWMVRGDNSTVQPPLVLKAMHATHEDCFPQQPLPNAVNLKMSGPEL